MKNVFVQEMFQIRLKLKNKTRKVWWHQRGNHTNTLS